MVNFNYTGPNMMPDTSKIDQASQQSFQQMANVEIDRYKRRQDMLARAMDFINIEVPETALQDQKQLADKYAEFKQKSVKFFQGAADQNRELNFEESAFLAKKKSELLKEAQAYNMYHQLLTHATNAYIADPEKYEEEFLTDIAAIDFKNPVEQRTNPMTILASNIYVPGVDLAGFEQSIGTADQFYKTDNKGYKTLDEQELMNNVRKQLSTDRRLFKRGVRGGQWTNPQEAEQYLFDYIKDKFTDVTPYRRPLKGGSGKSTAIPTDYIQPQDFNYGSNKFSAVTSVDLQKAGETVINQKAVKPVSVGFLPEATEDIEVTIPRPEDFYDPYGMFNWSTTTLKIEKGDPIPLIALDKIDASRYKHEAYLTYRGQKEDDNGNVIYDRDGNATWEGDLRVAKFDDKARTAFAEGTNTKDAYNYVKAYEADPALLNKAVEQWKQSKGITSPSGGGASQQQAGQQQAKPKSLVGSAPARVPLTKDLLTLIGIDQAMEDELINVKKVLIKNSDGTYTLDTKNQNTFDYFMKALENKGVYFTTQ